MPEPSTVCYAISSGEYSDYKINAVFSSREKAEAKLSLFEDSRIQEFPFDPEIAEAPAGMSPFVCYSHKFLCGPGLHSLGEYRPGIYACQTDWQEVVRRGDEVFPFATPPGASTHVWAKDESHAIKIAAERFAHHDAIKAGIAC